MHRRSRRTGRRAALLLAAGLALGWGIGAPASASPDQRPVVTSLSLHSADTTGGPTLTIAGHHLGHARTVSFGSTHATPLRSSAHRVIVRIPAVRTARKVYVRVTTDYRYASVRSASSLFVYRYPHPQVASMSAHVGATTGGGQVVVRGRYFQDVRDVSVGGARAGYLESGAGKLTVFPPPHPAGRTYLRVKTASGWSAATAGARFTYYPRPGAIHVDHLDGPVAGGATVRISGGSLGYLHSVSFGGATAKVLDASASSVTVRTPAHAAGVVTVTLTTGAGFTRTRYRYGVTNPAASSAPTMLDPIRGLPQSLSCPATAFCAIGDVGGLVTVDHGEVGDQNAATPGGWAGVECFSAQRCIAWSGTNGDVALFDGASWTISQPSSTRVETATCPSVSSCRLFDVKGNEYVFNANSWAASGQVVARAVKITCAADGSCTLFTYDGQEYTLAGDGTWTHSATSTPSGDGPWSCRADLFCALAVGKIVRLGHHLAGGWTWSTAPAPSFDVQAMGCSGVDYCVAATPSGGYAVLANGSWSSDTAVSADYRLAPLVDCPAEGHCLLVDHGGRMYPVDGGTLGSAATVDRFRGVVESVACASTSFCMAADEGGNWLARTNGQWGSVQAGPVPSDVSCPSSTFCLATGLSTVARWNGSSWTTPADELPIADTQPTHGAECSSASFCLVLTGWAGASGQVIAWDGQAWHAPQTPFGKSLVAVTCWADGECAGVSPDGYLLTMGAGVWQQPQRLYRPSSVLSQPSAISCPDGHTCFVGTADGSVLEATPDGVHRMDLVVDSVTVLSCATVSSCIAFGHGRAAVWDGTAWSVSAPTSANRIGCIPGVAQCLLTLGGGVRTLTY